MISPRVDIAFKKIFGVEENKDLLISLINSIVSPQDQVSEVILLNPYNLKSFGEDKLSILDIKAKGHNGKMFNIEIQISDEADYDKRALYYWAKLYTEQLKTSQDYSMLAKAIGIHILNFTSILSTAKYHNVFNIREKESNIAYFKDLELHTIELRKFIDDHDQDLVNIVAKIKTSLDVWMAFLTRHDLLNKDNLPAKLNDPSLKKALEVIEIMNFSSEERQAYEEHHKWLMIEANTLRKYEAKGFEQGLEQGIEQGRQAGEKIGQERGEEKGREEGAVEKERQLVLSMHKAGADLTFIQQVTGLSASKIKEIIDPNK